MKILVGCEESQAVTIAFRKRGFEAYSCDVLPCSGGHPEWHLQADVFEAVDEINPTLAIFHPPCTHLSVSGAKHFHKKIARQIAALHFVRALLELPIPHVGLENPISIISSKIRKPDQIIQPYEFGHMEMKSTCLWLKGLPKLISTNNVREEMMALPYSERAKVHYTPPGPDRARIRSKTYEGIAKAMAEQWGNYLIQNYS